MKTPIAIVMAFLLLLLSGCASMRENLRDARPDQGPLPISTSIEDAKSDPDVKRYYGNPTSLIGNFEDAAAIARGRNGPPTKTDLQRFLYLGFALSDVYCGVYINQLTNAYNHQRFARSTTSDVGGLAALGLGLLKNSAQVVSLTAGGFAFADNIFRNYSGAYMPPDNLRKNFDVLYRARTQLLEQLSNKELNNVAQVESRINFYASTCTMGWMDRLVSSVAEAATDDQIQSVLDPSNPTKRVQAPNSASTSVEAHLKDVQEAPTDKGKAP